LRQFDVAYFAASVDKPAANERFAAKLELDYPILSDPTKETARAYGVLKFGMAAARHTIYIDAEGRVVEIDKKVSVKTAGADMAKRLAAG